MSIFSKTATAALTVLALGTAVLATSAADASPRHGGGHGGWHGGHGGGHGGGHWGHGGHWRNDRYWGRPVVWGGVYGNPLGGRHCRIIVRYDSYGDPIGRRRVCYPGY